MKTIKTVTAPICLAAAFSAPAAMALETEGYFRIGAGGSSGSDSQQCFLLPGAASKYRLGNECEQLIELGAWQDFFRLDDGSRVGVYGMAQLFNEYDHTPHFMGDHGRARMVQAYAYWNDIAALNGGSLWAGRRYYKRNSIDISDFFYWNQSATGGGIEDVEIGGLRYSYAFSRKDNLDQERYVNRHDFNVAGFETNPGGELELGASYIDKPSWQDDAHSGWALTAQHKQADFLGLGGTNTLALQYGAGPGIALGSTGDVGLDSDNTSYRIVEFFDWQTTPRWGGQFQVVYQKDERRDGDDQHWLSVGARTVYGFTEQFKFATELGHDRVRAPGGTRTLSKLTLAPTWSPSGPTFKGAHPEVRFYVTYAVWNRAAQKAASELMAGSALSDTGSFGNDRHGANFGIQVEHSW
ncbi:maltoporin [Stutzerimonas chloritidismutans]|uniref:maltoporin n=1 Tax=Stutzerimonas chloritidismutans TaxID=203192 RepID=UPI003F160FBA